MIKVIKGNIFRQNVEALVNPVNCVGIAGKGLALRFKENFPINHYMYKSACTHGDLVIGTICLVETHLAYNPKFIANFPTKQHWRDESKLEDIQSGMIALCDAIKNNYIRSIAIPALGCGLGGLNWNDVKPIIIDTLNSKIDIEAVDIILIEPK